MGKYDKPDNYKPATLCYEGWVVSEDIQLYSTTHEFITIGKKVFHCLRRFSSQPIPGQCSECVRDIHPKCFFIYKPYWSSRLVDVLINVYKDKAKKLVGANAIWWDDERYADIVEAMHNPHKVHTEKKDYFTKLEDKHDANSNEVPF